MENKKELLRRKRHRTIKLKMFGTDEKPRLLVYRSLKNFSAMIINDAAGKVLFSFSTGNKEFKEKTPTGGNIKAANLFGEFFAHKVKEKGIKKIVFDRGGYLFQGRIKVFADALRKNGLEF